MRALILGTVFAAAATPAFAEMLLASTDVKAGSPMAVAQVFDGYGCTGKNISPSLSWSGEPAGTQSFAITMFDSDARNGAGWWHWTVFNIPASVHGLPAGASERPAGLPPGAIQGRTDFGSAGYAGPCPPPGEHAHHYEITVYALRVPALPLGANAAGAEVAASLKTNGLATANIVGRYGR